MILPSIWVFYCGILLMQYLGNFKLQKWIPLYPSGQLLRLQIVLGLLCCCWAEADYPMPKYLQGKLLFSGYTRALVCVQCSRVCVCMCMEARGQPLRSYPLFIGNTVLELTELAGQAGQLRIPGTPVQRLKTHATMPVFLLGLWDSNSGPCVYESTPLPSKIPKVSFVRWHHF